jgi:hypothetical protein
MSPDPEPAAGTAATAQPAGTTQNPAAGTDAPLPEGFEMPQPIDAPVDGPSTAEVERLVNAGDQLLEYGTTEGPDYGRKLDYPEDDSALGYYRRALALDAENARARAGIADIVAFYRRNAYSLCERGSWVQCRFIVRKGLAVSGEDEYLLKLQDVAIAGESGEEPTLPEAPPPG